MVCVKGTGYNCATARYLVQSPINAWSKFNNHLAPLRPNCSIGRNDRSTIDTDIQGSENHNNSNGNTPSDSLITFTPFIILDRRNWFNDNITPKTKIPKSIRIKPRFCLTFANQQRMPPIKSYSNLWSFYCAKPNVRIVRKLINKVTLV